MEQNKELRNRPNISAINCSFMKKQRQYNKEKTVFSTDGTGTTTPTHPKKPRQRLYILQKIKSNLS
jgi:hypothetical protein